MDTVWLILSAVGLPIALYLVWKDVRRRVAAACEPLRQSFAPCAFCESLVRKDDEGGIRCPSCGFDSRAFEALQEPRLVALGQMLGHVRRFVVQLADALERAEKANQEGGPRTLPDGLRQEALNALRWCLRVSLEEPALAPLTGPVSRDVALPLLTNVLAPMFATQVTPQSQLIVRWRDLIDASRENVRRAAFEELAEATGKVNTAPERVAPPRLLERLHGLGSPMGWGTFGALCGVAALLLEAPEGSGTDRALVLVVASAAVLLPLPRRVRDSATRSDLAVRYAGLVGLLLLVAVGFWAFLQYRYGLAIPPRALLEPPVALTIITAILVLARPGWRLAMLLAALQGGLAGYTIHQAASEAGSAVYPALHLTLGFIAAVMARESWAKEVIRNARYLA